VRVATHVWRRVDSKSTAGMAWKRQGEHITFKWDGFVDAPDVPILLARHNYEVAIIRRLLRARTIRRSLELGCGFGRLSPTFAELSQDHTAVDINASALQAARIAYPELDFREVDGDHLPFANDTFDLLATWTVAQHIPPQKIDHAMSEIRRVLRPDGIVLLCEETRPAERPAAHVWPRDESFYSGRLQPLALTHSAFIEEIDRLPGMFSPGRVMLFEPTVARS
jgi:SAM-dependent methyltransferase